MSSDKGFIQEETRKLENIRKSLNPEEERLFDSNIDTLEELLQMLEQSGGKLSKDEKKQISDQYKSLASQIRMSIIGGDVTHQTLTEEERIKAKLVRGTKLMREDGGLDNVDSFFKSDLENTDPLDFIEIDRDLSSMHPQGHQRYLVTKNTKTGDVDINIAGTKLGVDSHALEDIGLDVDIMRGNFDKDHPHIQDGRDVINAVKGKYPNAKIELNTYSLGGHKGIQLGNEFGLNTTNYNPLTLSKWLADRQPPAGITHKIIRTKRDIPSLLSSSLEIKYPKGYDVKVVPELKTNDMSFNFRDPKSYLGFDKAHRMDNFYSKADRVSGLEKDDLVEHQEDIIDRVGKVRDYNRLHRMLKVREGVRPKITIPEREFGEEPTEQLQIRKPTKKQIRQKPMMEQELTELGQQLGDFDPVAFKEKSDQDIIGASGTRLEQELKAQQKEMFRAFDRQKRLQSDYEEIWGSKQGSQSLRGSNQPEIQTTDISNFEIQPTTSTTRLRNRSGNLRGGKTKLQRIQEAKQNIMPQASDLQQYIYKKEIAPPSVFGEDLSAKKSDDILADKEARGSFDQTAKLYNMSNDDDVKYLWKKAGGELTEKESSIYDEDVGKKNVALSEGEIARFTDLNENERNEIIDNETQKITDRTSALDTASAGEIAGNSNRLVDSGAYGTMGDNFKSVFKGTFSRETAGGIGLGLATGYASDKLVNMIDSDHKLGTTGDALTSAGISGAMVNSVIGGGLGAGALVGVGGAVAGLGAEEGTDKLLGALGVQEGTARTTISDVVGGGVGGGTAMALQTATSVGSEVAEAGELAEIGATALEGAEIGAEAGSIIGPEGTAIGVATGVAVGGIIGGLEGLFG